MNEARQRRLPLALALADQCLQTGPPHGLSARAIGDLVNAEFAKEPATRGWVVTRLDVETMLARDSRFAFEDKCWKIADIAIKTIGFPTSSALIDSMRPGTSVALHKWQREALDAWHSGCKRGIIDAVTGSGKTRIAEVAIAEHLRSPKARAVVLVPTIELANQWLRRLHVLFSLPVAIVGDGSEAGFDENSILVYVARSAANTLPHRVRSVAPSRPVLLVADECHRYGSETLASALDAPFSATMGLSATPERERDEGMIQFVLPRLGPVVYEYGHDRGIGEAVISDFRMCFVGVDFAMPERAEHDLLSGQLDDAYDALVAEFPFLRDADPFLAAVKLVAAREEADAARHYLRLAGERRRSLSGARGRHSVVAWLAEQRAFSGRQTLLFHETINDCEHLARLLNDSGAAAATHHSDLPREVRKTTLARFARGEICAIAAPRTLDEGIDVPEASLAIIVAGTRVKRQTIQRIGRVLRRAAGKETAKVLKIYVVGTVDDPRLPSAPRFTRELAASSRATVLSWPGEAQEILQFITGAL